MNESIKTNLKENKDYRLKIGESIKFFREKKGYSQEDLAVLLKVNRSTISKIENGKFAITVDYIERLGDILDFDLHIVSRGSRH